MPEREEQPPGLVGLFQVPTGLEAVKGFQYDANCCESSEHQPPEPDVVPGKSLAI